MDKPKTKAALWSFIGANFGVWLPFESYTEGNSNPFKFIADCWFNQSTDVAAWACRSGGKTLCSSILAALEYCFTDDLQSRVLSGSEDQARNLYEYWSNWCDGVIAHRLDDKKVTKLLTRIAGGKLEILAASHARVRGPKIQRLYKDELDEIDDDISQTSAGMIASRDDRPARTISTSTWHKVDGPMSKLVEKCPGNGVSLHRWNLWESIANCEEDRHGYGTGCKSCGLREPCMAKALELNPRATVGIASKTRGLYRVPDVIKAYGAVSQGMWESEYLCLRPSVEGMVYPSLDPMKHCVDSAPADLRVYRAIDWGYRNFVCLWIGEDKRGVSYILDTYKAEDGTIKTHAEYIKAHKIQNIEATYADPAGRNKNDQTGKSDIDEFKKHGIKCRYTLSPKLRSVRNGIQAVKSLINPATGSPRLKIVRTTNNQITIQALQSYKNRKVNGVWIEEPLDPQEFEHIPDALRYYVINRQTTSIKTKAYGAV